MSSSIGAFSFLRMEGMQMPGLTLKVDIIDRNGTDSVATRCGAYKAREFEKITTEGVTWLATANAAADDYTALKGSYVTVYDDLGRWLVDVLIIDVDVISVTEVLLSVPDEDINYHVKARWILKPTW